MSFEKDNLLIIKNEIDHSHKQLSPVDQICKHNPDVVFSLGMGSRAINLFKEKNVSLKTGKYTILEEVLKNIDSLNNLNDGCNN